MKLISARFSTAVRQGGFSLTELMVALGVGLPVAGAVVLLLVQASSEQRLGLANTTVEESAYVLQSRITSCLRSMSAGQGVHLDDAVYDANSGTLLGYQTVNVQANTNGNLTHEQIRFVPASGQVIYIPDTASANQIVWMTSGSTMALRQLYFNTSDNMDESEDSSLVRVHFEMDDNGYAWKNPTNNPASIYRSFSVQMRSD